MFNLFHIISLYYKKAKIPFQDWSHPLINEMTKTGMPMRLDIKCFGKYTFRISNPALFMSKISGISDILKADNYN